MFSLFQQILPAFLAKLLGLTVFHATAFYLRTLFRKRKEKRKHGELYAWIATRAEIQANTDFPEKLQVFHFHRTSLKMIDTETLSGKQSPDEALWLFPKNSTDISIRITGADENIAIISTVRVAIDPNNEKLGPFLIGQKELPLQLLCSLVEDKLSALIPKNAILPDMDESQRKLLCARLSLTLQEQGFRALEIAPFTDETITNIPSEIISHDIVEAAEKEMVEQLEKTETPRQWNLFVRGLERAGMPIDQSTRDALNKYGVEYQQGAITSQKCAERIRFLAEKSAYEAEKFDAETESLHWSAEAIRARLRSIPVPAESPKRLEPTAVTPVVVPEKSERPSIWLNFDTLNIYAQISQFLHEKIKRLRRDLTQYASSQTIPAALVRAQDLERKLGHLANLEKSIPQRNTTNSQFRLDRKRMKKLLREMNQAITSTEMLEAYICELINTDSNSEKWNVFLKGALDQMDQVVTDVHNLRD